MQNIMSLRFHFLLGIMLPLNVNHRWMFAVKLILLFYGMFLTNHICESTDTNETCQLQNVLFISDQNLDEQYFPSDLIYQEENGPQLCFNIQPNKKLADCCNMNHFNCNVEVKRDQEKHYILTLTEETLSKQDIVVMTRPDDTFDLCMPSEFYKKTGFLLNIHKCLNRGNKNIRLSKDGLCGKKQDGNRDNCNGTDEYAIIDDKKCVLCKGPITPTPLVRPPTTENAANVMKNLSSLLQLIGNSTAAAISMGNITGVIAKLPKENQANMNFFFTKNADINIFEGNGRLETGFTRSVKIPKKANELAVKRNGSFIGILVFPEMQPNDQSSSFLKNEIMGIEMGATIENLSQTIDIEYNDVDKNGKIPTCVSWDGEGEQRDAVWITDGCKTNESNHTIICQCSHLTFFAILMSPPTTNISASDVKSLTYITSIGCGLSLFFLVVGLFMHLLVRKGKASQATRILMNLFLAMLILNLSFLTNESIAKLENSGACEAIAAVLHYSMLATFTWFFMQALHLYFNLRGIPTTVKHYMLKICITGWVIPAVVVIGLLASKKYNYIGINTSDGISAKICWIPDAAVHQGVNIGYYAVVFVFTFSVFIVTVRQIVLLPTAGKPQNKSSTKTNSFSILGLLLLLGITWAFAFFSHGPLLLASYYIFTILNSFQGFFLFIYYYNSSKIIGDEKRPTDSSSNSNTATSNTAITSPYG